MGLAESALILLGIGIVSSRFKAGVGLGELGMGIQTLVAAPLTGTGTGLSSLAGGLKDVFETFGDLGRGLSSLFESIPKLPPPSGQVGPGNGQTILPWEKGNGNLITVSGGDETTPLAGGGGNVPTNGKVLTLGTPTGAWTGTYSQATAKYASMGFSASQIHSLLDPLYLSVGNNV